MRDFALACTFSFKQKKLSFFFLVGYRPKHILNARSFLFNIIFLLLLLLLFGKIALFEKYLLK